MTTPTSPQRQAPSCKYHGCTKPAYVENGTYYDFCRMHANDGRNSNFQPAPGMWKVTDTFPDCQCDRIWNITTIARNITGTKTFHEHLVKQNHWPCLSGTCQYLGCTKPVFFDMRSNELTTTVENLTPYWINESLQTFWPNSLQTHKQRSSSFVQQMQNLKACRINFWLSGNTLSKHHQLFQFWRSHLLLCFARDTNNTKAL